MIEFRTHMWLPKKFVAVSFSVKDVIRQDRIWNQKEKLRNTVEKLIEIIREIKKKRNDVWHWQVFSSPLFTFHDRDIIASPPDGTFSVAGEIKWVEYIRSVTVRGYTKSLREGKFMDIARTHANHNLE